MQNVLPYVRGSMDECFEQYIQRCRGKMALKSLVMTISMYVCVRSQAAEALSVDHLADIHIPHLAQVPRVDALNSKQ
jgi:hypothetical protein